MTRNKLIAKLRGTGCWAFPWKGIHKDIHYLVAEIGSIILGLVRGSGISCGSK